MIVYILLTLLIIFTINLYKKNNQQCHNNCHDCPFRKEKIK